MPHTAMPNAANKPGASAKRPLAMIVVGFVATFFAVDRLIANVRLPEMESNTKAPARMLADYARISPPPDVLFVGCSYTAFGIDPEIVDAEAGRLGENVHSLNLGFGGALSLACTRLCELILEEDHPPRVIYYELSPGILNTRRPSLRYSVEQIGGFREAAVLWRVSPHHRWTAVMSQLFCGYYQWNDVRAIVENTRKGATLYNPKFRSTDRGWLAWQAGRTERDETIARVVRNRDGYWGDFEVGDFAIEAIRRIQTMAREHGTQVRFFEMPMSTDWQRVEREDVRRGYAATLNELRATDGIELWRCPSGLLTDADFFDADHLMPAGTECVSRAIARDLVEILRAAPTHSPEGGADALQ